MIKNNFIVIGHDGHGKTTLIKAVNKMLAEKGEKETLAFMRRTKVLPEAE
jgi:translation elongation factor EF-Tu-like GTPase